MAVEGNEKMVVMYVSLQEPDAGGKRFHSNFLSLALFFFLF